MKIRRLSSSLSFYPFFVKGELHTEMCGWTKTQKSGKCIMWEKHLVASSCSSGFPHTVNLVSGNHCSPPYFTSCGEQTQSKCLSHVAAAKPFRKVKKEKARMMEEGKITTFQQCLQLHFTVRFLVTSFNVDIVYRRLEEGKGFDS